MIRSTSLSRRPDSSDPPDPTPGPSLTPDAPREVPAAAAIAILALRLGDLLE